MILSITYEHIEVARRSWSCYENVNDGISIKRTLLHGGCPSYESSIALARKARENYAHRPLYRDAQTIHISRSNNEQSITTG